MIKLNKIKIFKFLSWAVTLGAITFCLGFSNYNQTQLKVKNINISISESEKTKFISKIEIQNCINNLYPNILQSPISHINFNKIENELLQLNAVKHAEVFVEHNGNLNIEVEAKSPLVRINPYGSASYYIDVNGNLMPTNSNFSARCLVVSGYVFEPYENRKMYSINQMQKSTAYAQVTKLDEIYYLSKFISNDTILNALIHQIYVNKQGDFLMYPTIGMQKIILGSALNFENKLNKLKSFYSQGMSLNNGWNKYNLINLKYKNIVVCSKI